MVQELGKTDYLTTEQILRREHAANSAARKVVSAPVYIPPATGGGMTAPLQSTLTGTSASLSMELDKAYRLVGSSALHFTLSSGASTATVSDVYLAAGEAMILSSGKLWDTVSAIKATGELDGIFQILEVR